LVFHLYSLFGFGNKLGLFACDNRAEADRQ
jgi:hypothetical protein